MLLLTILINTYYAKSRLQNIGSLTCWSKFSCITKYVVRCGLFPGQCITILILVGHGANTNHQSKQICDCQYSKHCLALYAKLVFIYQILRLDLIADRFISMSTFNGSAVYCVCITENHRLAIFSNYFQVCALQWLFYSIYYSISINLSISVRRPCSFAWECKRIWYHLVVKITSRI